MIFLFVGPIVNVKEKERESSVYFPHYIHVGLHTTKSEHDPLGECVIANLLPLTYIFLHDFSVTLVTEQRR